MSRCATRRWCRRSARSTSSPSQMSKALSDTTTAGTRRSRPRGPATPSTSPACRTAIRSSSAIPTAPASSTRSPSCGSTIRPRCRCRIRATADPNDTVVGVDFAGGVARWSPAQYRAGRQRAQFHQSDRQPARYPRFRRARRHGWKRLDHHHGHHADRRLGAAAVCGRQFAVHRRHDRNGAESLGYAGRIAVNPALINDPSRLGELPGRHARRATRPGRTSSTTS